MGVSKLRLVLLSTGEPQYKIAHRAGIPPGRLSEYALMRRPMPVLHILSLCEELNCDPDDILGEAEERV